MTKQLIRAGLALLAMASFSAWAHYPVMDCSREGEKIACQVGFSDGTLAQGQEVVIYSYDDEELARSAADGSSVARFNWPKGEFYIQFDAGHEDPAEFDYVEF
ncbi:hypothetical protein [Marinospirillum insulare]|uniref:Secreted protein n=1 Tax=Marinospirillum insulare TaxID=217169 RepID=A0ABQ5ZY60_9GAMM|nr:hypothetical protein [Marinospirillum insulare]GLR63601.1 hypothetical protein GCM10007878_10360 [Marinospirillum insulare]